MENDSSMKQKLVVLARKVKKIDDEIEKHMELFTQLRENPTDINGIVARRRKDFNGGFFQHLNFLVNAYNGLDERDAIARLGLGACLQSMHMTAHWSSWTLILLNQNYTSSVNYGVSRVIHASSSSLLATAVITPDHTLCGFMFPLHLKFSTSEWVKDIMYHIYTTTKESLKSISPPEMKLLKYLLNIEDPEERFGALATAFSPGDEHEAKDEDALYT
uniref:Uncharacterized protein n=1 Tax=Oryza rufipogon TaxID=4529 RepID=A0A0E0QHA4_ORYRU